MHIHWKKVIIILLDAILAVYLVVAFTSFNKPDETARVCTEVNINIQDETSNGFLDANEVRNRLRQSHLYPLAKPMSSINTRNIEDMLKATAFVKTAECYKTESGHVYVTLTQRMPIVRIKAIDGDDYYVDDNNQVMPNTKYTSDMIIATGYISKWYAENYISTFCQYLMANDLWKNLVEQINILPDKGLEIIPRVGNHIVFLGYLPITKYKTERNKEIEDFIDKKMTRLVKFYKYGLSQAGWNKYSYISLEFDNQIICKRRKEAVSESTQNDASEQLSTEHVTE